MAPRWHKWRSCRRARRQRRRLFWRVYLYGILMLASVAIGMAITAHAFDSKFPSQHLSQRLSKLMAADLQQSTKDPKALQKRLNLISDSLKVDVAVYRDSGTLVGSAGKWIPTPLKPNQLQRLHPKKIFHRKGHGVVAAIRLPEDGYVLLRLYTKNVLLRVSATIASIFFMLALASIPLVRAITRPLERITDVARALGQGDLSARTGLKRKDELGKLASVLDEMAARLEHTMRAEKELWANISHEMRTPLARIRVALELCEEEQETEAIQAHLSGIGEDLGELDRLINDVLMTARLDLSGDKSNAGFVLRRQPSQVADLVREATARFEQYHSSSRLQVEVASDLPIVEVDSTLMQRVLYNLLDNAAKYSEPATPITIRACEQEDGVVIEILDRGTGVPEEEIRRLFDHFYRTDRSRSRGTGGVGLGLTLCKRIVEAHGGTIWARNREQGGIRIGFSLPLHTT